MTPTKQLLDLAKVKAARLQNNTKIRLGGAEYEKSYWVFNFGGIYFIGSVADEKLPKFFKNKPEYVMSNREGVEQGTLQKLFL